MIQALAESADTGRTGHIPFRNSTLTRLLQESLGGNCKTSLVVSGKICVKMTETERQFKRNNGAFKYETEKFSWNSKV